MEDQRFDELARRFARPVSRRAMVKALLATAFGGMVVRSGTAAVLAQGNSGAAHWCHAHFSGPAAGQCTSQAAQGQGPYYQCGPGAPPNNGLTVCGNNPATACVNMQTDTGNCGGCGRTCAAGQGCCSGVCSDLTSDVNNCGVCGNGCVSTDPCRKPACANSTCTTVPDKSKDGTFCSGSNKCFRTYACQSGVCAGSNPVVCTAADQCHVAGTCDPATGVCSNPAAPDGTACNDGNACTRTDTCQGGVCVGGNPVVCTAADECHVAGTCDPATGVCSNPAAPDGTPCSIGTCKGGTCVAAVCLAYGATCTADSQCCYGICWPGYPRTCFCRGAGYQPDTGSCSACCTGACDSAGYCTCFPPGTVLKDASYCGACCSSSCDSGTTICSGFPGGHPCSGSADCLSHVCCNGSCMAVGPYQCCEGIAVRNAGDVCCNDGTGNACPSVTQCCGSGTPGTGFCCDTSTFCCRTAPAGPACYAVGRSCP